MKPIVAYKYLRKNCHWSRRDAFVSVLTEWFYFRCPFSKGYWITRRIKFLEKKLHKEGKL
jgi:hypothetical protein